MTRLLIGLVALLLAGPALAQSDFSGHGRVQFVDVTLTPDTLQFASGDVIDATTIVADAFPSDKPAVLVSVEVIDEDDQGAAFDIYFAQTGVSMGTENSAPGITDANSRVLLGYIAIATADYKDLGGVRIAYKTSLGIALAPTSGSRALYISVVNGSGTPTYTAAGLKLRLGILEY